MRAQTDSLNIADTAKVLHPQIPVVDPVLANHDSLNNFMTHSPVWYKSRYVQESITPLSLAIVSLSIISIPDLKEKLQEKLMWNDQKSSNYIDLGDDYVRYAPSVAAYALSAFGLKSEHKFIDRSVILTTAYIFSDFIVHNTKDISKMPRPDGINYNSMPSQHTAMSFVAATFLDHEFRNLSPWISVAGYLSASYVGYCRIARNAHYTCDVLMGAAIGILTTNITYWAYDGITKNFMKKFTLSPFYGSGQKGLYLCYRF